MLNNFFDKIYCINLDRRQDRWIECEEEFKKINLQVERVSAIDGQTITDNNTGINNGAYALVLTVQKIINEALAANLDKILILEDDIEFTPEISHFNDEVKLLPNDWVMLYFGGNHNGMNRIPVNQYFNKLHHTFTTHAVGINNEGMRLIADIVNTKTLQIDVLYAELQKRHNVYCFNKLMATQRPSYSDIENVVVNYKNIIK